MENTLKVNIIIVNFNSWEDTVSCINSIQDSSYLNFQVFVVDNASEKSNIINVSNWLSKNKLDYKVISREDFDENESTDDIDKASIVIVENHENLGYGAGNNVALSYLLKHRKNEYVWLLNPDTVIQKEVIQDLVDLAGDKQNKIFGNVMYYFDQQDKILRYGGFKVKNYIHGISYVVKPSETNKIDAISGASLFTRISTFKELGVLPKEYFMYWEETDFCTKAKKMGYSFEVNNKSKIFDKGGTASNSSFLREYLYLFNGFVYYKKYKPFNLPLILLSTIAKQIKALVSENKTKRKAIFYAHVDFISTLTGKKIDVQKRILEHRN